jgi:hypothetical protein
LFAGRALHHHLSAQRFHLFVHHLGHFAGFALAGLQPLSNAIPRAIRQMVCLDFMLVLGLSKVGFNDFETAADSLSS